MEFRTLAHLGVAEQRFEKLSAMMIGHVFQASSKSRIKRAAARLFSTSRPQQADFTHAVQRPVRICAFFK